MPYVTKTDMEAVVPADLLTVSVDDQVYGIETAGVWDAIAAGAARRIDAILSRRFRVPFAEPLPPLVKDAAITFAAHMLYLRRQSGTSPFEKEAEAMTERLQEVASGRGELTYDYSGAGSASPCVISEPTKTYREDGRLML